MKVQLNRRQGFCKVIRESGDPKFRDGSWGSGESRLLYNVKQILNRRGFDLIKKRMARDKMFQHMVSDEQLYLRSRRPHKPHRPMMDMMIWNPHWQIRGANDDFNKDGSVTLEVITDAFAEEKP